MDNNGEKFTKTKMSFLRGDNFYFFERKFSSFIERMETVIRNEEAVVAELAVNDEIARKLRFENIAVAHLNIAAAQYGLTL